MKKKYLVLIIMILSALSVFACEDSSTAPQVETDTPLGGRLTFAGSTTLQPLADKLGEAFMALYPDVTLDIAAGGSVVGIQAVHDGRVDIGMASRALKPEEAEGITQHKVAIDVIAIAVQEYNPVDDLTQAQLRDIYLGQITNWSEVGGADQPILVVVRGKNSGTRGAFDKIVLAGEAPAAPNLQEAVTAGDMAVAVLENAGAIGYVGFGNVEPGLKLLSVDGVAPSQAAAQDGAYQLVRPLSFLTGPLSQGLAQDFIDFALSADGQGTVEEFGWIPAQ